VLRAQAVVDSRDVQIAHAVQERTHIWVEVRTHQVETSPPFPENLSLCADANDCTSARLLFLLMRTDSCSLQRRVCRKRRRLAQKSSTRSRPWRSCGPCSRPLTSTRGARYGCTSIHCQRLPAVWHHRGMCLCLLTQTVRGSACRLCFHRPVV
jgi:hypothetical protein